MIDCIRLPQNTSNGQRNWNFISYFTVSFQQGWRLESLSIQKGASSFKIQQSVRIKCSHCTKSIIVAKHSKRSLSMRVPVGICNERAAMTFGRNLTEVTVGLWRIEMMQAWGHSRGKNWTRIATKLAVLSAGSSLQKKSSDQRASGCRTRGSKGAILQRVQRRKTPLRRFSWWVRRDLDGRRAAHFDDLWPAREIKWIVVGLRRHFFKW